MGYTLHPEEKEPTEEGPVVSADAVGVLKDEFKIKAKESPSKDGSVRSVEASIALSVRPFESSFFGGALVSLGARFSSKDGELGASSSEKAFERSGIGADVDLIRFGDASADVKTKMMEMWPLRVCKTLESVSATSELGCRFDVKYEKVNVGGDLYKRQDVVVVSNIEEEPGEVLDLSVIIDFGPSTPANLRLVVQDLEDAGVVYEGVGKPSLSGGVTIEVRRSNGELFDTGDLNLLRNLELGVRIARSCVSSIREVVDGLDLAEFSVPPLSKNELEALRDVSRPEWEWFVNGVCGEDQGSTRPDDEEGMKAFSPRG